MTWPGAPTIYYGDEAGVCGWTDPDNRRTYPWGHEDQELIEFHKDIIKIHKKYNAIMKGSLLLLNCSYKMISYGRFTNSQAVIVILNNDYEPKQLSLHVRRLGIPEGSVLRLDMVTTEEGYTLNNGDYVIKNNNLVVTAPRISAMVFSYSKRRKRSSSLEETNL